MKAINDILDTTWKKCIVIFIVVFTIVIVSGFLSINFLSDAILSNNVHTESIIILDKFVDENDTDNCFIVIDRNNKTYIIDNNNNNYDKRLFDYIEVGKRYTVTLKTSILNDSSEVFYITQVHNDTS